MRTGWVLLAVTLLTACAPDGPAPVAQRVAHWKDVGDRAYAAREWERAIDAYQSLYALLDPVPARRDARAQVAFRIGQGHAALARLQAAESSVSSLARYAGIWLREALALRPSMYQVWFQRAQLLELERTSPTRDQALVAAYEAYLAGAQDASQPLSNDETERVRLAQARCEALGS